MERCSYKKEACSAKGQKIKGVWVCDNHLVAYEVEQQRATHPDQSADAQATVEALQRERDELKELTNVICGHCCEPMAIPSRAVLQAALDAERDRLIKEYVRLFRLCEPIAKMLSELSILPIGCSREQELAWKMAVKNFRHYQRDYAADVLLQTALTPAGQRWTRSKPTVPGWYWWRVSPNTRPDLVLLRKGGAGSEDTVLCDVIGTIERGEWSFSDKRCCLLKDLVSGEFQGPLAPNEATAK